MNITDYLVEKSNGLLHIKPEINDWTGRNYHMFNTGSVEVETAEFLYGMVRLLKPGRVLDTGTHYGVSALYMGQALADNGNNGIVISLELDNHYLRHAEDLWTLAGLKDTTIFGKRTESLDYEPDDPFDFMLLDTEPQIRFAELVKFYPHLKPGGYVFIHDLHRHMSQEENKEHGFGYPFGKLPEEIKILVKHDKLRPFHFPTPRGLVGFYKTRDDDYKWV